MIGLMVVLGGVALILLLSEVLWKNKFLKGETQRKFVHISGGTFAAFWPWLISWRTIQAVSLVLLAGVLINRYKKFSHFSDGVRRKSYGDILSAVAILSCATLTNEPIIFALAILHLALADGLAAVVGANAHKRWRYKVLGQTKTVIGTMTFWVASICILGGGVLFATSFISFEQYGLILLALPPLLTFLENVSILGTDNITVPLAVVLALENIEKF